MPTPRRPALLLVLAALAAAALAVGRLRGPGPDGEGPGSRPGAPSARAPWLEGSPVGDEVAPGQALVVGARVAGRVRLNGRPGPALVRALSPSAAAPVPALAEESDVGAPGAPWRALAQAEAAPDGRFDLGPLPLGRVVLVARSRSGARGTVLVPARTPGATLEVTIDVAEGALFLEGRVEHLGGTPWSGEVLAVHGGSLRPLEQAALESLGGVPTDASGRFRLEGLAAGEVALLGWTREGGRFRAGPVALPRAGPFVVVLPAPRDDARVRVTDAVSGRALAGAWISWWAGSSGATAALRRFVRTGADGQASVDAGFVRVESAGYLGADRGTLPGETTAVPLVPLTGRREGVVREAGSGRPAAGAEVLVADEGGNRVLARAAAGPDGAFVLEGLPEGEATVLVLGGGWVSAGLARLTLAPTGPLALGPGEAPLELEAERAGRASGRVSSASGAPVAGARVLVAPKSGRFEGFPGGLAWLLGPWLGATSDAQGRFSLATLVPGLEHVLRVEAAGHPTGSAGPFVPGPDEETALEVRLPGGRSLTVRTLALEDGAALPGVRVSVRPEGEAGGRYDLPLLHPERFTLVAVSDAEGAATLHGVAEGGSSLRAEVAGRVRAEALWPASAPPGEAAVLRLARALPLAGRVRVNDGSSPEGLHVSVGLDGAQATVGADGAFSLQGLAPGRHRLEVALGWAAGALLAVDVEAGASDLDLVVEGPVPRPVRVRVLDPEGRPVPQFDVEITRGSGSMGSEGTGGVIEVEAGLEPAWVAVTQPRDATGAPLPLAPGLLGPLDSDGVERVLRLGPGRTLSGRVVGAGGEPLGGVAVHADALELPDGAPLLFGARAEARTDAEGRFAFGGLLPGLQRLSVEAPPGFATLPALEAEAGADGLLLRLVAEAPVVLRLTDPGGAPVAGAVVDLAFERGRGGLGLCRSTTDGQGRARLAGLTSGGAYVLEAHPPASRPDLGRLRLTPWSATDAQLRLPAARVLRGRTVDEEGRPVPSATVVVRRADGGDLPSATSDATGAFVLGHLPPEPLRVEAQADVPDGPGGDRRWRLSSEPLALAEGGGELRLVLRRGRGLLVRVEGLPRAAGEAWLGLHDDGGGGWLPGAALDSGGQARLTGLQPEGRYSLHLEVARPEPRVAYLADVRHDAGEVTLRLVAGQALEGRVTNVPRGRRARVTLRAGALEREARTDRDGRFVLPNVPPGRWPLRARVFDGSVLLLEARAEAGPGVPVELVLTPP